MFLGYPEKNLIVNIDFSFKAQLKGNTKVIAEIWEAYERSEGYYIPTRHLDGANFLLADGHAEWHHGDETAWSYHDSDEYKQHWDYNE